VAGGDAQLGFRKVSGGFFTPGVVAVAVREQASIALSVGTAAADRLPNSRMKIYHLDRHGGGSVQGDRIWCA